MSDQGRVLRSQSRLLREVHDSISVAPKKARVIEPSSADRIRVHSLARKLFLSASSSASTFTSSHPLQHREDQDIELEDSSATPVLLVWSSSILFLTLSCFRGLLAWRFRVLLVLLTL